MVVEPVGTGDEATSMDVAGCSTTIGSTTSEGRKQSFYGPIAATSVTDAMDDGAPSGDVAMIEPPMMAMDDACATVEAIAEPSIVVETIDATLDSGGAASAGDGPISQGVTIRKRPFYGPDVSPDAAFNVPGPIDKGGGATGRKKKGSIVES